uniref:exodeoxyribonuclease III n=1 Tax=Leptobrachium leishanense TaxID=445787 RepID=A0A8C5P7P0_9ANUR
MSIKITSLNVKGLKSPNKRRLLLRTLNLAKSDIAFIQETHINKAAKIRLTDHRYPMAISAHSVTKRNGVSILLRKTCPFRVTSEVCDSDGRYVLVSGSMHASPCHLLNIYALNARSEQFWVDMTDLVTSLPRGLVIVGGDMNAVPCAAADRRSPAGLERVPGPSGQDKAFYTFLRRTDLLDAWRVLHPDERDFTFYSAPHGSYSRINLFLCNLTCMAMVLRTDIHSITWSDHADISLQLAVPHSSGPWMWKLNASLLRDPEVVAQAQLALEQYFSENAMEDVSP